MDFENFSCARDAIESVSRATQQSVLIREYCSEKFSFSNMVDIYYRSFDENAILIFMVILVIYPILFMSIATVADKYLSSGMQDLAKRLRLSPTLAAVTLIAFANGAPDVLAAFSSAGKDNGAYISVGALLGAFIFSSCLVVSNVANAARGDVRLPRRAVQKELGFYALAVVVIVIFGFIRQSGWPFVAVYLSLYVVYIGITLYLEKTETGGESAYDLEQGMDSGDQTNGAESLPSDEEEKPRSLVQKCFEECVEPEDSMLDSIVGAPLKALALVTISYLENPLVQTPAKYPVLVLSTMFALLSLELIAPVWWVLLIIGSIVAIGVLICDLLKVNENIPAIITELISVFAAIGWIKIFSTVIIDFISFLAFYFNIDEVILSSILLSAGNTIGDFFGNGALAASGEEVMGAIASYSGQIFNNFVGFSASVIVGALGSKTNFDIFALNYYKNQAPDAHVKPPVGNYFLIAVIVCVFVVIGTKFALFAHSDYVLKKSHVKILVPIYAVFFVFSMVFGLIRF